MRFPKSFRLRSKEDFASIRQGKRIKVGNLRIIYRLNQLGYSRLGLAISRKYGNAVQRNRLKRQLRSCFRMSNCHATGIDMLIIPATSASYMQHATEDLGQAIALIQRKMTTSFV